MDEAEDRTPSLATQLYTETRVGFGKRTATWKRPCPVLRRAVELPDADF